MQKIPRLIIAATQSGAGKTTIVTGLLAALKARGISPAPFKVGPDYIDPGYHALAAERQGENLDTWLTPRERLAQTLAEGAEGADLALIEGVMGLFDGGRGGVSSTAQIAKLLKAPVVLVIDAKSMGASAAAIALGFREYDKDVNFAGVILNRVGSPTHEAMLREAMASIGVRVFGVLRRSKGAVLPERHLGLLPAQENRAQERDLALEAIAAMREEAEAGLDIEALLALAKEAPALPVGEEKAQVAKPRVTLAVARDEAFSFYYRSSLRALMAAGARLVFFSPLHDAALPEADGLLFGGGFPEIFAGQLAANEGMRSAIRARAEAGLPIYAECGGYMYLLESLVDFEGREHEMAGVFTGRARMTEKLQTVGYIEARLQQDSVLGRRGAQLRGHEFHFSVEEGEGVRPFSFTRLRNGKTYEAGRAYKNALGSYLHINFAGAPEAARALLEACEKWRAAQV